MRDRAAFEHELAQRQQLFDRARSQLETRLKQLAEDMSKIRNLRPRLVETRVKPVESLMEKALEHGWDAQEAFERAGDLVGARIVCNNTVDVYRMKDCILECADFQLVEGQVEDYVSQPKPSGYRGLHVQVRIPVPIGSGFEQVPCEVQIRTIMQDAWATVAHEDYYKAADTPEAVAKFFPVLAQQLDAAQRTADLLREQLEAKQAEQGEADIAGPISPGSISAIYSNIFGDSLSWAELTEVARLAGEHGVETVQEVFAVLSDEEMRQRLNSALREAEGEPSNLGILLAACLVAKHGLESGFAKYVVEYVGLADVENHVQERIGYCTTCQPYEDGQPVWVLGRHRRDVDELVVEVWYDLYGIELLWEEAGEVVEALGLHCPNCGCDLEAGSEVAEPDD